MATIKRRHKPTEAPPVPAKKRFVVRRAAPPPEPEVHGTNFEEGEFVRSKYGSLWHRVLERVPGFVVTGCEHYVTNSEALICPAAGVQKCTDRGCWPELKRQEKQEQSKPTKKERTSK